MHDDPVSHPDEEEFAADQSAKLVKKLSRSTAPLAKALGVKIRNCEPGDPCQSGACPKCNSRFRVRLLDQALSCLPTNATYKVLSVIPKAAMVSTEELSNFSLKKFIESRQRSLLRALPEGSLFVGGVDVSWNTHNNGGGTWCFHIYGFIILPPNVGSAVYLHRRLRGMIKQHCPPLGAPDGAPKQRPLRLASTTYEDMLESFLYLYKHTFYHRSGYTDLKRNAQTESTNARKYSLKAAQAVELALHLDCYPVGTRLLLNGLTRRGRFGQFELFATNPQSAWN